MYENVIQMCKKRILLSAVFFHSEAVVKYLEFIYVNDVGNSFVHKSNKFELDYNNCYLLEKSHKIQILVIVIFWNIYIFFQTKSM